MDTHMDTSMDTHMDMSMDIHMEMPIKSKVSKLDGLYIQSEPAASRALRRWSNNPSAEGSIISNTRKEETDGEKKTKQAKRAEGEKPSPEQVKALALRMAEQRERAAEDPTQDMNRPEPSGDEPLDLSEPEDWGEASPFESRQAPRTKADLLNEIRQRADRRTGQQEAEQRQIDPWQAQPPQRRGHGR